MRRKTNRPKWAKPLSASQWNALKKCQRRTVPSLAQLKRDLEWQKSIGANCWDCSSAMITLNAETD